MVGAARARSSVHGQIMSIMSNIGTLVLRIANTFIDPKYNNEGQLVFHDFSLLDNSVSGSKLFITAYHAAHTEESAMFAAVCLFESCLIVFTIMIHLNRNFKTWMEIRIVGMATLLALGIGLLRYGMLIPLDHSWHTVVVPSIICSIVWLEVVLLVRTQIKENGGSQHLLRDLLMKLGETPISIVRCAYLIQNPDTQWDAQKILLLLGSGPPMLMGTCQIAWLVYKAGIIPYVAEWVRTKIPRVSARKTEQAAGATMGSNGGRDAGDQVADEHIEAGKGLPVTIGASQVGSTAVIMSTVIKWPTSRVLAGKEEQAWPAGVAMEKYGGGQSGQQLAVMASAA